MPGITHEDTKDSMDDKSNKPTATDKMQRGDDGLQLKLKSLFGEDRVTPEGCHKGPPGGHSLTVEEQNAIDLHNKGELEKLHVPEQPTALDRTKAKRRQWLANLDDDDLNGHLLRAGSDVASPKERATSNRALRNLYKNAVANNGVGNLDSMLKDRFTRTSHMIMCSENERHLFGNKPPGRKAKNVNRDAEIADVVARHIINDNMKWDPAVAAVAKAEESAGHYISEPRVREIFRQNSRETMAWVKYWNAAPPFTEDRFNEWLNLPFDPFDPPDDE